MDVFHNAHGTTEWYFNVTNPFEAPPEFRAFLVQKIQVTQCSVIAFAYFCWNIDHCDFFACLIWCSESSKSLKHAHSKVECITFIAQLPTYIHKIPNTRVVYRE